MIFTSLRSGTKDGTKVDRLLYAGSNLERARRLFAASIDRASGSRSGSGRVCSEQYAQGAK
ncbi:MAG TPA: hypothetical protein VFA81_04410, partial [Burkholderiales bacterium]|nr:hypothetical protein [Burkholderiales bacterium]